LNPILKKLVDGVDQIVSEPSDKEQYDRIVIAGKKILFDKKTHDSISWLREPTDLAVLVTGVSDLIAILSEKSNGTIRPDPAMGAAVTLVADVLDFTERSQGVPVTQEIADAAVLAINEKMSEGGAEQPAEQPVEEPQPQPQPQPQPPQGLIGAGA